MGDRIYTFVNMNKDNTEVRLYFEEDSAKFWSSVMCMECWRLDEWTLVPRH
jgi:hypothetical protein